MEKWLQSKPNPYIDTRKVVKKVVVRKPTGYVGNPYVQQRQAPRKLSKFSKGVASQYGMPIQMFKDSDRDGVANVFDCKPHNKKKQDVMRPSQGGLGRDDMYARAEQIRQAKLYKAQMDEALRLEQIRMDELARIENAGVVTRTVYRDRPASKTTSSGNNSVSVSSPSSTGTSSSGSSSSNIFAKLNTPVKIGNTTIVSKPAPAPRTTTQKLTSFVSGKGWK